jgi:hypothetical protein
MPRAILTKVAGTAGNASAKADKALLWMMQKLSGKKNDNATFTQMDVREFKKCIYRSFIALFTVIFSAIVIYVASTDPNATSNKYYMYTALIVLPILVGSVMVLPIFSQSVRGTGGIAIGLFLLLMILSVYFFYRHINPQSVKYMTYIMFILLFLIIIVGLAIFYKIFIRYVKNLRGWGGFFAKLIFYLPCLFLECVEYLSKDFKNTSNMIFVLLGIEVVILLIYIYLPKLIRYTQSLDSKMLLNKPMFLNTRTYVGNSKAFRIDRVAPDESDVLSSAMNVDEIIRKNYGISMWVNVNTSYIPKGTQTPLFYYGQDDAAFNNPATSVLPANPSVVYANDASNNGDAIVVYLSNEDPNAKITFSMTGQKWHYIAINYDNGKCDVFLDGNLEGSYVFDGKLPKYNIGDVMIAGWDYNDLENYMMHQGLYGAICHIKYYSKPITHRQIMTQYNLYRFKNPPIV